MSANARPYFDAHAHVHTRRFDADRAAVIARAREAGVGGIVCAGDDLPSSHAALALAQRDDAIWATAGIHPHEAAGAPPDAEAQLLALCREPRVVAVGEIGLDYFYDHSPRPVQRDWFARQLDLARRAALPVVIHTREAAEDTLALLRDWRDGGETVDPPGVIHCFSYDVAWAERFLALGFHLSIPGTVTYPSGGGTREVARMVPDDRFTVETDCPYLSPQSHRGKRNEPAYVVETVREIATLRGTDPLRLAEMATGNARRLYRLDAARGDAPPRGAP